jgi:hypothetical protein
LDKSGIVWVFVIIVVLVKLAAELIEIAYSHFTHQTTLIKTISEKPVVKNVVPSGWLIFSLGLCAFIVLVAVFGPLLAPNERNGSGVRQSWFLLQFHPNRTWQHCRPFTQDCLANAS